MILLYSICSGYSRSLLKTIYVNKSYVYSMDMLYRGVDKSDRIRLKFH
jgi:hypothetical protein